MIIQKKVELSDLFYDLVYVYAISQTTGLMHHLQAGQIPITAWFHFSVALILLVNSWVLQTVFTNRYGRNSVVNIVSMFAQMACLLVGTRNIATNFHSFFIPFSLISLILLLQYLFQYMQETSISDRQLILQFIKILTFRTSFLFLSIFLPLTWAIVVSTLVIVLSWWAPSVLISPRWLSQLEEYRPINFPHLLERLSLLTIITFGEMLIGISDYFLSDQLSASSFLLFLTVTNLFMIYIIEIDHLVDDKQVDVTGNGTIYFHYPIVYGLSMITISFSLLKESDISPVFTSSFLYGGILVCLIGVLLHQFYHVNGHYFSKRFLFMQLSLPVFAYVWSLLQEKNIFYQSFLLCLVTTVMMFGFIRMRRQYGD